MTSFLLAIFDLVIWVVGKHPLDSNILIFVLLGIFPLALTRIKKDIVAFRMRGSFLRAFRDRSALDLAERYLLAAFGIATIYAGLFLLLEMPGFARPASIASLLLLCVSVICGIARGMLKDTPHS